MVQQEQEGSKQGGTFSRTSVQQTRMRYDLTSYHNKSMQVEVLGRIPVSRDKSIEVNITKDATPADETDVDGKSGILLWRLNLQPRVKASVKHYFDVEYPKDDKLYFTDY